MFSNPRDAELLLWHVNRKTDEKIRHPVDDRKWKHFDLAHQEDFSNDPKISGLDLTRIERIHSEI
jgi:hypothetical protein